MQHIKRYLAALALLTTTAALAATLNFSITIPAEDIGDVVAAQREYFGNPALTQAQIEALIKAEAVTKIRLTTRAYRQRQAASGVVEPGAN